MAKAYSSGQRVSGAAPSWANRWMRGAFGLSLVLLGACGESAGGKADTASCPEGTNNCPCDAAGGCGDGLACTQGFCVPETCEAGAEGCACHANGTCDAKDGKPMLCEAGKCVEDTSTTVDPGGLGDSCDAEKPCGLHEGTQLACTGGVCILPGCTPGELGCTCDGGACDAPNVCEGGVCVEPTVTCTAGTEDCACKTDGTCGAGLVCQADLCVVDATLPAAGVKVGAASVRSCGVVLPVSGLVVQFEGTVLGRAREEGGKLALAFTAKADAALTEPVATLQVPEGVELDLETLTPSTVECFDRLGQPVASPGLVLQ